MNLTLIPFNLPGDIYRSPMPFGTFDLAQTVWQEYLEAGIEVVVMLTPREEAIQRTGIDLYEKYLENGLDVLYFPIDDFGIPNNKEKFLKSIELAIFHLESGTNLAIHCFAGIGRTGMFLALMARKILHMPGETAVQWIREYIPGAIESASQFNLVVNTKI